MQGDGSDRTGLYVVSEPFKAQYQQESKQDGKIQEKEGYFAYRIDFEVETQAGRFYAGTDRLRPWVFVRISCQRYAHEPLTRNNYGRDISVLTRIQEPRLAGALVDGTLVRVRAGKRGGNQYVWLNDLPELLAEAHARPLVDIGEFVEGGPGQYGVSAKTQDPYGDEYYLVHAEGYKYERRNHAVKTGFHFDERQEIIRELFRVFKGMLVPDKKLTADQPIPAGMALPAAMRHFKAWHLTAKQQRKRDEAKTVVMELPPRKPRKASAQEQLHQRLRQTMLGLQAEQQAQLMLVYREKSTGDIMAQQVRKALLLTSEEPFPRWLAVTHVLIGEAELLAPLEPSPEKVSKAQRNKHFRLQNETKRQAWQHLLEGAKMTQAQAVFAFIEIGEKVKGVQSEQRGIRAAVREAAARLGIASQMLQRADYRSKAPGSFSWGDQSRVGNAALDLLIRQPRPIAGAAQRSLCEGWYTAAGGRAAECGGPLPAP